MNTRDRALLVGMVLGDGCLSVRTRKNANGYEYIAAELILAHSAKQADYLEYKAALVNRMLPGNARVKYSEQYVASNGKRYKVGRFAKSHPYMRTLRKTMYPEGRKTITRRVLDMLSLQGIALWFMDDGGTRYKREPTGKVSSISTDLCTYCTQVEAEAACEYFDVVHAVGFRPIRHKGKYILRANTAQSRRFGELVGRYIHPSMAYKLDHIRYKNGHECQAPAISRTCIECTKVVNVYTSLGRCRACYERYRRAMR